MNLPVEDAADRLAEQERVHVVAHIDADGIAAAAVAISALEREGIPHAVEFVKQMERAVIDGLPDDFIWFVDLGAGILDGIGDRRFLITDHHPPSGAWPPVDRGRGPGLDAYLPPGDRFMVNPHLCGLDGATEVSGAGVAYLIARHLDPANVDLAALAVIGAVGDLQDSRDGRLVGLNRAILGDAVANGDIEVVTDLRLFGRETRAIGKFLAYADDPDIPTLRNDPDAALELVRAAGVRPRSDGEWRAWSSLAADERNKVFSAVTKRMLLHGKTGEDVRRLVGEVYLLAREAPGTPFREAKEYATVLNSCGRYDRGPVGLRLLQGDAAARQEALDLLAAHRRNLVDAMRTVENGVVVRGALQFFDGGGAVRDTIVGIVAGMLLSSGNADSALPIFGFADAQASDGRRMLKVSARIDRSLRGAVDLDLVMREAAGAVEGFGGGHDIAAGGAIPEGRRDEFLSAADRALRAMRQACPGGGPGDV